MSNDYKLTYLAFGAGVQSSALLVMSNLGLFDCPRADVAIFADTQSEPAWVYEQVKFMTRWSKIPVHTVTAGNLGQDAIDRAKATRSRFATIPVFSQKTSGRSQMRRQCTREYKVAPIEREVRSLLRYRKREHWKHQVRALIGISLDEAYRMRDNQNHWITNCYPLVEARLRRNDCVKILQEHGIPVPRKSACVFCPYHSDQYWEELRRVAPSDFDRAVEFDSQVRDIGSSGISRPVFVHSSCRPLSEVDFTRGGQLDLFGEECEGMCGV